MQVDIDWQLTLLTLCAVPQNDNKWIAVIVLTDAVMVMEEEGEEFHHFFQYQLSHQVSSSDSDSDSHPKLGYFLYYLFIIISNIHLSVWTNYYYEYMKNLLLVLLV